MTVRIQVTGRNNKPVKGARVFVKWVSGGHSERYTDDNGIVDLGTSAGTAEYVQVNDQTVLGKMWLEDKINPVSYHR